MTPGVNIGEAIGTRKEFFTTFATGINWDPAFKNAVDALFTLGSMIA